MTATGSARPGLDLAPLPTLRLARAAWRLHRRALLGGLVTLGLAALALAVSGALRPGGTPPWRASPLPGPAGVWLGAFQWLPFVVGASAGAVVGHRDADRRTARFAWTQGAGRVRWLAVKLATVALPLASGAAVAGGAFAWWWLHVWGPAGGKAVMVMFGPAFGLYPPMLAGWLLASFAFSALLAVAVRAVAFPVVATLTGSDLALTANIGSVLARHVAPVTGPASAMPPGRFWLLQFAGLGGLVVFAALCGAAALAVVWRRPL